MKNVYIILALAATFLAASSCSSSDKEKKGDSDSLQAPVEFHADNDIAMNVRSIIDAINVGQPLDSSDYNFTGILTDGNGRPLYTDVQGAPGQWEIKVLTEQSAVIQNLYLGDLLPDELVQYLLDFLGIKDNPLISADDKVAGRDDNLQIYRTGTTDLIIERQTAKAPNGDEGPLIKIILRKTELAPTDSIPSE